MPGRSRSATEERALERSESGAGHSHVWKSRRHYVAPARSVTAKVPGIIYSTEAPPPMEVEPVKMTYGLNDIWIM